MTSRIQDESHSARMLSATPFGVPLVREAVTGANHHGTFP